jgi:hypothetical protein
VAAGVRGVTGLLGIQTRWVKISALLCFGLCLSSCAGLVGPKPIEEEELILIPPPPEEPRLQFLTSYSADRDVLPPGGGFREFILGPEPSTRLGKPYGVAIHDGQILVCDTMVGGVAIFDVKAQAFEELGVDRNGRLRLPINISVDEDGTRYVADSKIRRVMVYGRDNRFLRSLGDPATWKPSDVAIAGERLYVADAENGQVVVLEKETGRELDRFGGFGVEESQRFLPTNLDVDSDGNLYVADSGNGRVFKFDARGKLLRQFGSLGSLHGQFVRPKGVAVDRENRLYVVDAAHEVVQIFDSDGRLLLFFGGAGDHRGGLNLPAKVAIDYDNTGLFADLVAPGYEIEYLVVTTSQYGRHLVNVYWL